MNLGSVNDRKLGDEIQTIQSQRVKEIVSDGESFISNHLFERKPVLFAVCCNPNKANLWKKELCSLKLKY